MSDDSVPPSNGDLNPSLDGYAYQMAFSAHQVLLNARQNGASAPAPTRKPTAPRRRPPRKAGLYAVLHAAQQHGFTHPDNGFWVMLPKEFDAILALEHKAVAQVVLEVLRQTIGKVVRQEWALISYRHFARDGLMSRSQAEFGITEALKKRYIQRRPSGPRGFEYSIRWRGTN
jgi:hypothetical protein